VLIATSYSCSVKQVLNLMLEYVHLLAQLAKQMSTLSSCIIFFDKHEYSRALQQVVCTYAACVCCPLTTATAAAAAQTVVLLKAQAIAEMLRTHSNAVRTDLRSVVDAVSEREESIRCKCNSLKFFHECSFLISADWLRRLLKVVIEAWPLCLSDVPLNVAHTGIHPVLPLAASLMWCKGTETVSLRVFMRYKCL
jgi:hypothetical protein